MRCRNEYADAFARLLLIGGPIALVRYGGWPPLPTTRTAFGQWWREPISPDTVTAACAGALWLIWIVLAASAVLRGYRWIGCRLRKPRPRLTHLFTARAARRDRDPRHRRRQAGDELSGSRGRLRRLPPSSASPPLLRREDPMAGRGQ